jgi:DNA modification methylase
VNRTLIVGDARVELDKIAHGTIQSVVTSPPYWTPGMGVPEGFTGAEPTDGTYLSTLTPFFDLLKPLMAPNGVVVVVMGDIRSDHDQTLCQLPHRLAFRLKLAGWNYIDEAIWQRDTPGRSPEPPGRARPLHETIMFFSLSSPPLSQSYGSIWNFPMDHFPVGRYGTLPFDLVKRAIALTSKLGDTILDPFAGNGTTLIAANKMGRHAIGIDIDPDFPRYTDLREKAG